MADYADYSSRGSSPKWIGIIPLRVGAGITLLYLHGWDQAIAGWHHLIKQTPWPLINLLEKGSMPSPPAFAYIAATVIAVTAVCWMIGFLTRFFSALLIPVALGALLLANRLGEYMGAETSLLYFFIAITLILTGPGWLSVDKLFHPRGSKRR